MNTQPVEETVVFTKPELTMFRGYLEDVTGLLQCFGTIRIRTDITLTEDRLMGIYPRLKKQSAFLWNETLTHLCGARVTAMVIVGTSVVRGILTATGTEVDPYECDSLSLRGHYQAQVDWRNGIDKVIRCMPHMSPDGEVYYRNFIHRARTHEEAQQQIKALFNGDYERLANIH